jgi:hypothetical protein
MDGWMEIFLILFKLYIYICRERERECVCVCVCERGQIESLYSLPSF